LVNSEYVSGEIYYYEGNDKTPYFISGADYDDTNHKLVERKDDHERRVKTEEKMKSPESDKKSEGDKNVGGVDKSKMTGPDKKAPRQRVEGGSRSMPHRSTFRYRYCGQIVWPM